MSPSTHTDPGRLPEADLREGIAIRSKGEQYIADLRVKEAKTNAAAIERVETLLKILAAWNDGFRVRLSRVQAVRESNEGPVSIEKTEAGFAGYDGATIFIVTRQSI